LSSGCLLESSGSRDERDGETGTLDDPEPLVREHAAWALARLGAYEPTTR